MTSFSINNSKDIICDSLFLLDTNNTLQNVLDLISAGGGGGGGSGITTLTGSGAAIITGTATSKNITVDLSMFSTTTQMTTLLNNKQNILTAGTNITISNNTISSSQAQLTVQLDGVNQACSTLNFVQNNALLSGGVLNVSRLTHYDKIPLIYSTQATIKDITQDVNSNLLWGTDILTTTNALNTALSAYVTTASLSNYSTTAQMTTLLNAKVDDAQVLTNVPAYAVFTDTLYTHPSQHSISMITGLQTALDAKQANLTAGTNITISGNTITATSGGTPLSIQVGSLNQACSTVNFAYHTSSLSNGILTIDRLSQYDKIPLINASTIKDLTMDSNSDLKWGTEIVTTNPYLSVVLQAYSTTANLANNLANYTTTSSMNTLLNGKVDDAQLLTNVPANAVFTDTLYTHPSQHSIAMITGLQTALNAKQANLTASTGVFLNGSTLTSYDLRWLTSGVPTLNIQCLHFKSGFTVTETFNVSTSQNQLDITSTGITDAQMKTHVGNSVYAIANCGITSAGSLASGIVEFGVDTTILATRSHVDPELAKISDMVNGVSGISLGTGTGASQRIACFETAGNGNYFYGIGLVEQTGSLPGTGIWASTASNVPHQNSSSSSGVNPHLMVSSNGNVGIGVVAPTQKLHVVGNILCSGTISGSSKSFDIEHPDPEKMNTYRLRHWCIESDKPGGTVMYTKSVEMNTTSETFNMPDWFKHLTKDVIVFVTPFKHFGSAWGECVDNILHVHTSTKGKWNILITASRADVSATTICPQEVEYIPEEPEINHYNGMPSQ